MFFKPGDIVLSAPGYSAGCFCILAVDLGMPKNIYLGLNLVNLKTYRLSQEGVSQKVGVASEEFLLAWDKNKNPQGSNLAFERGRARAEHEAWSACELRKPKWKLLATSKPGDWITIRLAGGDKKVKFHCVLERSEKFVFSAETAEGTVYRYPVDVVVVEKSEVSP